MDKVYHLLSIGSTSAFSGYFFYSIYKLNNLEKTIEKNEAKTKEKLHGIRDSIYELNKLTVENTNISNVEQLNKITDTIYELNKLKETVKNLDNKTTDRFNKTDDNILKYKKYMESLKEKHHSHYHKSHFHTIKNKLTS